MTSLCHARALALRRGPWSFLSAGAWLVLACLVRGEEGGECVLVEEILWQGYPDGLEASSSPGSWALAPDGSGFLYIQGAPWRRVMFQPLKPPGSAPRMVGTIQPFGSRAPRFSPRGDSIYFTALEGSPRDGTARAFVVRVAFPGMPLESVYPAEASGASPHAVFLDVHPQGKIILVGTAARDPSGNLPSQSDLLEVEEISLDGPRGAAGRAEPLGFRVSAAAAVAYSASGQHVEYSGALESPAPGSTPPIHAFDRSARTHELLRPGDFGLAEKRGDREVFTLLFPHLGSSGWDGFPAYASRDPGSPADAPRLLAWGPDVFRSSVTPPLPVAFGGGLLLARGGHRDQPLPMVLGWTEARLEQRGLSRWTQPSAGSLAAGALLFDPRFLGGAILARRHLAIEQVLLDLRRSLGALGSPAALRGTLIESARGAAAGKFDRLEVLEMSPGYLRVERIPAAAGGAASPADGGNEPGEPRDGTEEAYFDGERCWVKSPAGSFVEISPVSFAAQASECSLYRLFLDPARLGDPFLCFEAADSIPPGGAGGPGSWRLQFSYPDGYRGELLLEAKHGLLLPASVRTRLLFETRLLEREVGQVPEWKTLGFKDWRAWNGRLVPHRLEIQDGLGRRVLELAELREKTGVTRRDFQPPIGQVRENEEEKGGGGK